MGIIKLFNSPQNIEDCFNKSESYPDGEIHVTFNGGSGGVGNNNVEEVFKIHRMILACKNLVFKQLFSQASSTSSSSNSSRITISNHDPKLVRKLLIFYYSGKLEWVDNHETIPLLQLSHEYFAPEIVVSLLHHLHDNFTSIIQKDNFSDSLKLFHIFNRQGINNNNMVVDCCKNTFIDTIIDPNSFITNDSKPTTLAATNTITRQRSNVNTFTKHYVAPFKLKEKSAADLNFTFHERYGGRIWNEKFKTIQVKCLENLQENFSKFIKSEPFLSIDSIEEMKQILLELSKLNGFGSRGQFLPAVLNWVNHDHQNRSNHLSILFQFLQDLSEICMPELTISTKKDKPKPEQEDENFKFTIELPTPPKRERKEENTPEITIKKKNSISFLGIDMEEANSASTPGSPIVSLMTSPQLDEVLVTPPSSRTKNSDKETPPSSSSTISSTTLSPTYSTTSSTEGKRASRSKSAFIRPRNEQELGTFGHLKRLATPFSFSHSERDDPIPSSDTPPKTTFEVEEETLSDWQEVGRIVSYIPVKRVEEVIIKKN